MTLSESGDITGTAQAEVAAALTFSVRDSANFQQDPTLELKVSAHPAPFLLSGKYDASERKLVLTGLNLAADVIVNVNEVQIAPPVSVKFKQE